MKKKEDNFGKKKEKKNMWGMEKKQKKRKNMQRMEKKKLVGKATILYSTRFRVLAFIYIYIYIKYNKNESI